ncbi:phosphatidylglycerophosphatase A [Planktotalea frisia]|uniref:phosphatidylglycerophosphatase A family protein n=1 Tax=Planktotalea frisia TaxID=696762 RepID=UPI00235734C1|nr:phosphatidylglycerophosphatase A [Planktotalea frisia]
MNLLARLIGTVFYVGYMKPAPGTWGSLIALPLGFLIFQIGGIWLFLFAIIIGFFKGWWATELMTKGRENHDPSEIVVDEVVGQWIAIAPVFYAAWRLEIDVTLLWPGWLAAFLLFRAFDIFKPWLVGWADRRDDALGVMLDDVIAGIFAAITVLILAAFFHLVIM